MALFFNKCNVAVNGSGVMAESASIKTKNSLQPIRSVGKKGIIYQAPNGPLTTTYNISYIVETNNEPNYNIVQALRSIENSFHNKGVVVEVGGISALCYLQTYSLTSAPNRPVKARVSYQSWKPTTGSLSENTISPVSYNSQRSSGIAHSWTSYVTTSATALTNKSYGFNYDFSMTWQPAFAFGRTDPYDVRFINATETINLTKDASYDVVFSGSSAAVALLSSGELVKEGEIRKVPSDKSIKIQSVGILCEVGRWQDQSSYFSTLSFDMSDSTIVSSNTTASLDDLVKTELTLKNYY